MIDKLKNRWAQIPSNQKRTVVLTTVLTAIIALSLVGYYIKSKSGEIPQGRTTQGNKEIVLDSRLLEKSAYLETQKEIAKTEEKLSLFRKELDEIREQKEKTNLKEEKHPSPPVPKVSVPEKSSRYPVTPLPPPPQPPASTTGASPSGQAAKGTAETVGDIELVSNPQSQGKDPKQYPRLSWRRPCFPAWTHRQWNRPRGTPFRFS